MTHVYDPPALLVSWFYWEPFAADRHNYEFRDYALDSGAFSAHNSGAEVELEPYIEFCLDRMANDPECGEVYALDVIGGDWKQSLANTEAMWSAGIPAIPAYHCGEPEKVLRQLCKDYPKVALGGAVGMRVKDKLGWAKACFARVWPKPLHGFGFGLPKYIEALPFHSVDATNWEFGPTMYGNWKSMPRGTIRGSNQPMRMEVEWYLRVEERARARWRKEMVILNDMLAEADPSPVLRLAVGSNSQVDDNRRRHAFSQPDVRLGVNNNRSSRGPRYSHAFPSPDIRLAVSQGNADRVQSLGPPDVRLAVASTGINTGTGKRVRGALKSRETQ